MNILELALLRGGFTPEELGLPDSVLDGAGNQPLSLRADLPKPKPKREPHPKPNTHHPEPAYDRTQNPPSTQDR